MFGQEVLLLSHLLPIQALVQQLSVGRQRDSLEDLDCRTEVGSLKGHSGFTGDPEGAGQVVEGANTPQ